MNETLYLNRNLALINYTKAYYRTSNELLSSSSFETFLAAFLKNYAINNPENCMWLVRDLPLEEAKKDIVRFIKVLLVLDIDEIKHPYFNDRQRLLSIVEDCYSYWRGLQRVSLIFTGNELGLQLANFLDADDDYNKMVLNFYRTIQEKIQGSKNRIYRQLQAGTNASLLLRQFPRLLPTEYDCLKDIPFISRVMLRTPLIIHPKSNKRHGMFTECDLNPITEFSGNAESWMCYPCKVGDLLCYIYFHRDFTSSAIALANLFELASADDCANNNPDMILLFGNQDEKDDTVFYHDQTNNCWVGKVSYADKIEYFGYLKKMTLTLHNLAVMRKNWLPLHGAMINLQLKDGTRKGIVLIGDSGAGKSETIEALTTYATDEIVGNEVVFDDMGSMYLKENEIYAKGTEIGAFVRLDDLDKGSTYRDLDRSIFFNPETLNARVCLPCTPYDVVVKDHKIDMFLYANNYTDKRGLKEIKDLDEAKQVFIEGKRFALGTTQEKGLSTTFFANPFGPMQKENECLLIIDEMFNKLKENNVFIGEIYTCLGLENKGDDGLIDAAKELLEQIKK